MKKLTLLSFVIISFILISCEIENIGNDDDDNKGIIEKDYTLKTIPLKDAVNLFVKEINSHSKSSIEPYEGNLAKQTINGEIESVYFITVDDDSLAMHTQSVHSLNEAWLLLKGAYYFDVENEFHHIFYNKDTESFLCLPKSSDFDFVEPDYYKNKNYPEDKDGNIYLPSRNNNIYKFSLTSDEVTANKYLPDNEYTYEEDSYFFVSVDGICFYENVSSKERTQRLKNPNGSIHIFDAAFNEDELYDIPDIDGTSSIKSDIQFFTDNDNKLYFSFYACLYKENVQHSNIWIKIYEIKDNFGETIYQNVYNEKVDEFEGRMSTAGTSHPFRNEIRNSVILFSYVLIDKELNIIYEYKDNTITKYQTDDNYRFHTLSATKNFLVNNQENTILNLNDYQETSFNIPAGYDLKHFYFSSFFDILQIYCLHLPTGKNGILEIDLERNNESNFTPLSTEEIISLVKLKK